ncbi:MAG: PfkB family carbohydrate kinase [Calditrichaceae bacterium]
MKSARNVNVIDPTGCGDTYLAAFGITYFKTGDVSVAAKRANLAAALTGSIKGSPKANLLRNKLDAHTMEDE